MCNASRARSARLMGDPATRYRGATENGSSFGGISGYSVGPGGEAAAPGGLWILQWINLRDLPTWRSVPGLSGPLSKRSWNPGGDRKPRLLRSFCGAA
jgi:hypothetical protein